MASIFKISDDSWLLIFHLLRPHDFISVSQACSHFHNLSNPMRHSSNNKYWKDQCEQQWKQTKHNCCNSHNYACDIALIRNKDYNYNYNYFHLFRSMMHFIVKTVTNKLNYNNGIRPLIWSLVRYRDDNYDDAAHINSNFKLCGMEIIFESHTLETNVGISLLTCMSQIYTLGLTIDEINDVYLEDDHEWTLIRCIIAADSVDLFKIWLCNMSGKDDKFDINKPVEDTFHRGLYSESKERCLVAIAFEENAKQIASFLLGINSDNVDNDDNNNSGINNSDDDKNGNIVNSVYNFPNMIIMLVMMIHYSLCHVLGNT